MYKDVFVTDRSFLYIPFTFFSNNLIDYVQQITYLLECPLYMYKKHNLKN